MMKHFTGYKVHFADKVCSAEFLIRVAREPGNEREVVT